MAWIIMKSMKTIEIMGRPTDITDAAPGLVGFIPVFKDKESAEEFMSEGDEILPCKLESEKEQK